jgi:hypothetical protein
MPDILKEDPENSRLYHDPHSEPYPEDLAEPIPEELHVLRIWESNIVQGMSGLPVGTTVVDYEFRTDFDFWQRELSGAINLYTKSDEENGPNIQVAFYAPGMALKVMDTWIDNPAWLAANPYVPEYDDPNWQTSGMTSFEEVLADHGLTRETLPQVMTDEVPADAALHAAGFSRKDLTWGNDDGEMAVKLFGWRRGASMPADMDKFLGDTVVGSKTSGLKGVICPECRIGIIVGDEHNDTCSWWAAAEPGREMTRLQVRDARFAVTVPRRPHIEDTLRSQHPIEVALANDLQKVLDEHGISGEQFNSLPQTSDLRHDIIAEVANRQRESHPMVRLPSKQDADIEKFKKKIEEVWGPPKVTPDLTDRPLLGDLEHPLVGPPPQNTGYSRFRDSDIPEDIPEPPMDWDDPRRGTDHGFFDRHRDVLAAKAPEMLKFPVARPPLALDQTRLDLEVPEVGNEPKQTNPPKPVSEDGSPVTGRADIAGPVTKSMSFGMPKLPPLQLPDTKIPGHIANQDEHRVREAREQAYREAAREDEKESLKPEQQ